MSSNTTVSNNDQQIQVNTNLKKLFPYSRRFRQFVYTSGGAVNIPAGTVMGVVKATGKVVPCVAANTATGDAFPIGVLARDIVLSGVSTINVSIAVNGTEVREDLLVFNGAETLNTVVGDRTFLGWLLAVGIYPVPTANATKYDNAL